MTRDTQLPQRPPAATVSNGDMTCEIWDLGTHRLLHAIGPHYGRCGLVAESLTETGSSVSWLLDLFAVKGNWLVNEVLRAESALSEEVFDYLADRYDVDFSGARVLEIGCGFGATALQILRRGAESLLAMDVDVSGLDMACRRVADFPFANRALFVGIGEDGQLPVRNGAFDVVAAFEVFEHVPPTLRSALLRALYAKVRPGGTLVLSTPNRLVPKDLHTSGLWFVNYMPRPWVFTYARLFSRRCRGRGNAALISAGLLSYSWREAHAVLSHLGAVDLGVMLPPQPSRVPSASRAGKLWNWVIARAWALARPFCPGLPYDALANHLFLAFRRPDSH